MRNKKLLSVLLVASFVAPVVASCGATSSEAASGSAAGSSGTAAEKTEEFSYWLGTGEDAYYNDYADNPAIRYMTKFKKWGVDKNVNISLKYQIPATGSQLSSINTMIGSGDYTDIIDAAYYKQIGTIGDLYKDGVILDLTDYVKKYMPNYLTWIDKHPAYKKFSTTNINGETKYLEIYDANDSQDQWGGFCYRRDWLVKYGKNPTTNAAFTGGYDANKVWTDDVIFPSGGSDPTTFSDWEWMAGIFKTALTGEGITDGYAMSLGAGGYYGTGDLMSSFGTNFSWFLDNDGKTLKYGANSEGFREYVKLMADWYAKGYINTKFADYSSDMFYKIDTNHVRQGKVGMWYGTAGELNDNDDISEGKENNATNGYTNGICVFGARQPINDKYGTAATQNITPFNFYKIGLTSSSIVLSKTAKDKDIPALLSFFDYMYSDEGAALNYFGLDKAQYEECQDPLYKKYNLTDGAYSWVDKDGKDWVEGTSTGTKYGKFVDALRIDDGLSNAMKNNRCIGRRFGSAYKYKGLDPVVYTHGISEWNTFDSNFDVYYKLTGLLSGDDAKTYSSTNTALTDFISAHLPAYVQGTRKVSDDTSWNSFVNAVNKYKPAAVTTILQTAYDAL
jgi:maltose-binding protein MalE